MREVPIIEVHADIRRLSRPALEFENHQVPGSASHLIDTVHRQPRAA